MMDLQRKIELEQGPYFLNAGEIAQKT